MHLGSCSSTGEELQLTEDTLCWHRSAATFLRVRTKVKVHWRRRLAAAGDNMFYCWWTNVLEIKNLHVMHKNKYYLRTFLQNRRQVRAERVLMLLHVCSGWIISLLLLFWFGSDSRTTRSGLENILVWIKLPLFVTTITNGDDPTSVVLWPREGSKCLQTSSNF